MAAEEVLAIHELLEMVLVNIDVRDVLLLQRVSKTWKATIEKSPSLQRLLFLRPVDGGHLICDMYKGEFENGSRHNLWEFIRPEDERNPNRKAMAIYANPFLVSFMEKMRGTPLPRQIDKPRSERRQRILPPFVTHFAPSWLYPEASWRKMLTTQPASVSTIVLKDRIGMEKDVHVGRVMRAGELFDLVQEEHMKSNGLYGRVQLEGWNIPLPLVENAKLLDLPEEDEEAWHYCYGPLSRKSRDEL